MDELREALDKAAASPDPAVRNMATEYLETQQKADELRAFFRVYKQGIGSKNGVATASKVAQQPISRERIIIPRVRSKRTDDFSPRIEALVLANGQPMQLRDLFATYLQAHSDDQTTIETFRQRLVKHRKASDGTALISLIPQRGYWWAATPLPEASDDA